MGWGEMARCTLDPTFVTTVKILDRFREAGRDEGIVNSLVVQDLGTPSTDLTCRYLPVPKRKRNAYIALPYYLNILNRFREAKWDEVTVGSLLELNLGCNRASYGMGGDGAVHLGPHFCHNCKNSRSISRSRA